MNYRHTWENDVCIHCGCIRKLYRSGNVIHIKNRARFLFPPQCQLLTVLTKAPVVTEEKGQTFTDEQIETIKVQILKLAPKNVKVARSWLIDTDVPEPKELSEAIYKHVKNDKK